jgi:hypothetical protein
VRRGGVCHVELALKALKPKQRDQLAAALVKTRADGEYTYDGMAISRWLRTLGVDVTQRPIQRHRRGDCRCARSQ